MPKAMIALALPVLVLAAFAGFRVEAASADRPFEGHFSHLDVSLPGCGNLALASPAVFVVRDSGVHLDVAVPCIEMQVAVDSAGEASPLASNVTYRIVVSDAPPTPDMRSPFPSNPNPWYVREVMRVDSP